jgi:hypothetical protein
MIFHTAAEQVYYDLFFLNWHTSIKKFWPDARFSLRFVGPKNEAVDKYCSEHDILLTHDPITLKEISAKFTKEELPKRPKACYGYYALSRWMSMPADDDVGLTDVDLVALQKPNLASINHILSKYQQYRITGAFATKEKPKNMMINFFRKDVVSEVNRVATELLSKSKLMWNLDLRVRDHCNKNFSILDEKLLTHFNGAAVPKKYLFGYCNGSDFVCKGVTYKDAKAKAAKYKRFFDLNKLPR